MTNLVAQLELIHKAGASHLPTAAAAYESAAAGVTGVSPPASGDAWESANSAVNHILIESGENVALAGDVLRLLAFELAEQDGETGALLDKIGLEEVPSLGPDGWSDEED